jgi:hypothetical protein
MYTEYSIHQGAGRGSCCTEASRDEIVQ